MSAIEAVTAVCWAVWGVVLLRRWRSGREL